jgi:hypothetical protein
MKRKEQEKNKPPIEPKDQMVGNAKVVKESTFNYIPTEAGSRYFTSSKGHILQGHTETNDGKVGAKIYKHKSGGYFATSRSTATPEGDIHKSALDAAKAFHAKHNESLKEDYLTEYLTDSQREKYSKVKMTRKARQDTDHFFGKDNDQVREDIKGQDEENKSEIHKEVERHLNTNIDVENYKKGVSKDKYGRDVKIGRLIRDEKLRNQFANDNTRAGVKSSHGHYCTIVRGTEVAGQTNSAPNAEHPNGHSWGDESCKNVDNGVNKKYLKPEVEHGTVAARIHDSTGKEIYRATLHPYHNAQGHTIYRLNGEYGVKHSNFTKHAHDIANRLSGEHKGGSIGYKIHPKVYDDNGDKHRVILHPGATTKEHLDQGMKDPDSEVRLAVLQHPNVTKEHLDQGMKDSDPNVRREVLAHQQTKHTTKYIDQGMKDPDAFVRFAALKHPNVTHEHLDQGIKDEEVMNRAAVVMHPKATKEHLDQGIKDKNSGVRANVFLNPKATKEHLDQGIKDKDDMVRRAVVRHPNATKEHLEQGMRDKEDTVRRAVVDRPDATKEHLDQGMKDSNPYVRLGVVRHLKATKEHLDQGIKDKDDMVRRAALERMQSNSMEPKKTNESKVLDFKSLREAAKNAAKAFHAKHNESLKDSVDEGIKSKLAAGALAATMALGAHARVSGDHKDDPNINRLTGKPHVTQAAEKPAETPEHREYEKPDKVERHEGLSHGDPITIHHGGKEYKGHIMPHNGPRMRGGKTLHVPHAMMGIRGLGHYEAQIHPSGHAVIYK